MRQTWLILLDLPFVEHHPTDHLHTKVAHAEHPFAGFSHDSKSLGQQVIKQGPLIA